MADLDFFHVGSVQARLGRSVFLDPKHDPTLEEPNSHEQSTLSEHVDIERGAPEATIENGALASPDRVSQSGYQDGNVTNRSVETANENLHEEPNKNDLSLFVGPETPSASEDSFGDEYQPPRDVDSLDSIVPDIAAPKSSPASKAVVIHKRSRSSKYKPASISAESDYKDSDVSDLEDKEKPAKKRYKYKRLADDERLRKAAERINESHPISTSKDNLSREDKMLLDMRANNCSWPEIREKWTEMFGTTPANSTLPNRFYRLRNNLGVFTENEDQQLLESKTQIEQRFDESKWTMIASSMQLKMGNDWPSFSGQALRRRFKQLMEMDVEDDEGLDMEN